MGRFEDLGDGNSRRQEEKQLYSVCMELLIFKVVHNKERRIDYEDSSQPRTHSEPTQKLGMNRIKVKETFFYHTNIMFRHFGLLLSLLFYQNYFVRRCLALIDMCCHVSGASSQYPHNMLVITTCIWSRRRGIYIY